MKKLILLLSLSFSLFNFVNAQNPPNAFNYSAVARNATGQPIATTTIGIQITILKTSPTGSSQYSENHFVNTDDFGLFNLVIGAGAVQSGSMATIDWSNDNYYLKVGMDAAGGTNFLTMGTTQMLSVPYALYAKNAGSVSGGTGNLIFPTITTNPVTGITSNSATFSGAITNANSNQIIKKGIVYSTTPNPTVFSNKIEIGNGIGIFDTITSMNFQHPHFLQSNTEYFVRAYAVTENNITYYGNEESFSTLNLMPPTITTNAITDITSNSAAFGGAITNANGNEIMERGIVYSTTPNPTVFSNKIEIGNGIGTFDTINGLDYYYGNVLKANTTYYVRAYAVTENNFSTYGNEVSFTTLSVGQTGPGGGIIFFDKGNSIGGWQYLEAAPSDQSTGIAWGCNDTFITETQSTVGSGKTNTTLIVAGCNEASFAAKICDNLSLGGQSDWFLPSSLELSLMYGNLHLNNQGNFNTSAYYWSSSEGTTNNYAWRFSFSTGYVRYYLKYNTCYVRAVRAF